VVLPTVIGGAVVASPGEEEPVDNDPVVEPLLASPVEPSVL
jgi:hypothetical protein